MKKSKVTRSLLAACSIVALSAVMYGCVHSGDGPSVSALDLSGYDTDAGATVMAGTYSTGDVPAALASAIADYSGTTMGGTGDTVTVGGYTFTCVTGPCSVSVSDDEERVTVEGTINVAVAMTMPPPPPDPAIAERAAIASAIAAANTAVGMVDNDSTDAEVAAADAAITAARMAIANAANVPAEERAANTGTVGALEAQLTAAKTSRTAAMAAADEAERMAAINAAKDMLTEKEEALAELGDDATDEDRRDAQRMVEAAANALRDALRANGGSDADIEAAIRKSAAAKIAADALQETITAAANAAERMRMEAISAAETTLSEAEKALEALGEDATDKETRDAHRAVEGAAANLITVLQANEGTADQIEAATMKRDSAKMMADELTSPIEIADQRKAITDALAAAATAVAAVDDDATDAQVKAADDAIKTLREAIAAATALPEAERTAYTPAANAHASALETAKGSRDKAIAARDKDQQDKQRIADNKAGELVAAAIVRANDADTNYHDASADLNTAGDAAELDLPASLRDESLVTEHKDGATTIALRRSTGVKLTAMNTMSPGDGWTAKRFSFDKNNGAVATNLSAPTVKVEVFSYDVFFADDGGGASDRTAAPDATGLITFGADPLKSEYFSLVGFPAVPPKDATSSSVILPDDFEVTGSYRGVAGKFACTAACTVTRTVDATADTDNVAIAGTLTFTPTLATGQTTADIEVERTTSTPDADYLRFGYWMTTTERGSKVSHMIETFADATGYGNLGTAADLEGKATYSGAAAGIYVHKAGTDDSLVVSHGEFVAAADLTATFGDEGDGKIADDDTFGVTGTVSGFQSATADHDLSGWTLMLNKADLGTRAADGTVSAHDLVGFSGTTSGGTGTDPGAWSGTFFGGAPATGDTETADDYPTAAIGEFNGHFSNGHVAGAFGAEKDD